MKSEKIYLVAIGGTAMAPLAVLLARLGHHVSGSDVALYPPMSDLVAREKITVLTGYRPENIPQECDRVIIGNAVPRANPEVEEVLRRDLPRFSLPQAVAHYLLPGKHSVVIAGTHGKTTTSALVAWLLYGAGQDPGFLVGGELKNFGCGFRWGSGPHFVLEGDEYNAAFFDRGPKFLHYQPRTLLINNIEFDHADLYPDLRAVKEAFHQLARQVPPDGVIVYNADDPAVVEVVESARARRLPVSLGVGGEISASAVETTPAGMIFDLRVRGGSVGRCRVPLYGQHNLRNVLMAIAAARALNVTDPEIADTLPKFEGVKRRLEILAENDGILYVDDFAHHPTAVGETLSAARQRWPGRRIWAVFEPRSITAGRKFFERDYARALARADAVILAPVFHEARFPAEELIDRNKIVASLKEKGCEAVAPETLEEIEPILRRAARPGDVVILMSSGDFADLRRKMSLLSSP